MTTDSLHYEAETLMLNRFFRFEYDSASQKWLVQLRGEMVTGYKRILFPPGQDVRNYPESGRWAEKPWFHSAEAASKMAAKWAKEERPELWEDSLQEAIEGRKYRSANKAAQ